MGGWTSKKRQAKKERREKKRLIDAIIEMLPSSYGDAMLNDCSRKFNDFCWEWDLDLESFNGLTIEELEKKKKHIEMLKSSHRSDDGEEKSDDSPEMSDDQEKSDGDTFMNLKVLSELPRFATYEKFMEHYRPLKALKNAGKGSHSTPYWDSIVERYNTMSKLRLKYIYKINRDIAYLLIKEWSYPKQKVENCLNCTVPVANGEDREVFVFTKLKNLVTSTEPDSLAVAQKRIKVFMKVQDFPLSVLGNLGKKLSDLPENDDASKNNLDSDLENASIRRLLVTPPYSNSDCHLGSFPEKSLYHDSTLEFSVSQLLVIPALFFSYVIFRRFHNTQTKSRYDP